MCIYYQNSVDNFEIAHKEMLNFGLRCIFPFDKFCDSFSFLHKLLFPFCQVELRDRILLFFQNTLFQKTKTSFTTYNKVPGCAFLWKDQNLEQNYLKIALTKHAYTCKNPLVQTMQNSTRIHFLLYKQNTVHNK